MRMGLWDYLAPIGQAVFGPIGGLVGSVVSGIAGRGSSQSAPFPSGGLSDTLARAAFLQGFREMQEEMTGFPQTYSEQQAMRNPSGLTAMSQQQGGHSAAPGWKRRDALGLGGGTAPPLNFSQYLQKRRQVNQPAPTQAPSAQWGGENPVIESYYRLQQARALRGESTLPENVYQGAVARGQAAINAQAAAARSALMNALARRGVLNSGALSSGLADIQRARLGALGNLYGGLEQQNLAATRAAQLAAMNLYAQERILGQNLATQQAMQQQAIDANRPSTGALLGSALMNYLGTRDQQSPADSFLDYLERLRTPTPQPQPPGYAQPPQFYLDPEYYYYNDWRLNV